MLKKLLLIFLFVGVTVGVAYLLFRFFFAGAPSAQPTPGGVTTPTGGLPSAGTGRPAGGVTPPPTGLPSAPGAPTTPAQPAQAGQAAPPLVTHDLTMAARATSGGLSYYDRTDGKFYRTLPDGTQQALSTQTYGGVSSVVWSPAGDKAIIQFP